VTAVLLVACGGATGGLLRAAVGGLLPDEPASWGWSVLVVNAVGGFALGALLAVLARRPSERVRLAVGTGLLGGLTTFSGLVVEAVLLAEAAPLVAAAYVVVAVASLLAAGWLGSLAVRSLAVRSLVPSPAVRSRSGGAR
jgi:CrcB protein